MIKEIEKIYNDQIKNLNDEINLENEQIKLLVKFSKDIISFFYFFIFLFLYQFINNKNKTNAKDITKQACQTIKILYNYNNQNNRMNNNIFLSNLFFYTM